MGEFDLRSFWAKTDPFQSVYTHSLICGHVAQQIMQKYLSEGNIRLLCEAWDQTPEDLVALVGYIVSLHDVGKLEYSFQCRDGQHQVLHSTGLSELFVPGIRHEKTGRDCMKTLWREIGEDRRSAALLSKVIGAHHQGKTGNGNFRPTSSWFPVQKELEAQMREAFLSNQKAVLPQTDPEKQGAASALLLGLMILSDWIASGQRFADAENWIDSEDAINRITERTEDFLSRSGLQPCQVTWPESFCGLWPFIPPDGRRPLQIETEALFRSQNAKPLLVLLEAPMGEGKTEVGVYAAIQMAHQWGKDGLYFALPTAATANQMIGRVQALLDMHGVSAFVRLLHSMAWLESADSFQINSQDESDGVASWLVPTKRGLMGQFAVGTVDQAMFAATNVKYGVLRLLGLANKVLIIDEIHSYDAYMSEILVRLLEWCRALQIPVVMLSATLPAALKEKLLTPYTKQHLTSNYPLITMIDQDGTVTEHQISGTGHRLEIAIKLSPILGDIERIAEAAVDEVKEGGCLCVLMNTVAEAQAVYRAVKMIYDGDLLLFHAQFPAGQRADIEKECIRRYGKDKTHRPKQSILIATQVVEQSLDVDFDCMITSVAPVDLLLQRMGRVFRHDNSPRPASHQNAAVEILIPEKEGGRFGASSYVYPECLLESAVRLLKSRTSIQIPEDLSSLVQDAYDPKNAPEEEAKHWMKKYLRDDVEAGASQQYLLNPPDKLFSPLDGFAVFEDDGTSYSLSAKTRLGEPTVRIALLSEEEIALLQPYIKEKNGERIAAVWDRKTAERIIKQSVSVRISRIGSEKSGLLDIKGDILLSGMRIFPAIDGSCRMENGKILRFDPELGLLIEEGEL